MKNEFRSRLIKKANWYVSCQCFHFLHVIQITFYSTVKSDNFVLFNFCVVEHFSCLNYHFQSESFEHTLNSLT